MQRVSASSIPAHLQWGRGSSAPPEAQQECPPSYLAHKGQVASAVFWVKGTEGKGSLPAEWILLPNLRRTKGCQTASALLAFGFGASGICPGIVEKKGPWAV